MSDIYENVTVTISRVSGDGGSTILTRGLTTARWIVGAAVDALRGLGRPAATGFELVLDLSASAPSATPARSGAASPTPSGQVTAQRRRAAHPHVRRPANDVELEMIGADAMLLAT